MDERIEDLLAGHRDAITVKRVFGEPFEKNGVTVIPAAKVMGGGGGGEGETSEGDGAPGKGSGSGFGLSARPAGAYVIRGDEVKWEPAVDVDRIVAGAFALAGLLLWTRARRWRRKERIARALKGSKR